MNATAPGSDRSGTLAWWFTLAALATLPWVGVGLITLVAGRAPGTGLQPSWLLMGLAFGVNGRALFAWLWGRRRGALLAVGPAALTVLISGAGLLIAPVSEPDTAVWARFGKQVIQLVIMAGFVVLPAWWLSRGRPLAHLARAILVGAGFQIVYGLLQVADFQWPGALPAACERVFTSNPAIFAGSDRLYLGNVLHDIPRLRGTMCEPLYLGSFLLLALAVIPLAGWSGRRQVIWATACLILLAGTWSRGAWLAAACGLAIYPLAAQACGVALPWRRWGLTAAAVAGLATLIVLGGLAVGNDAVLLPGRRLLQSFSNVDWSNLTRLYSMQAAWRGFLASPVVGIGWGQFGFHYANLVDPMGLQAMFTWPVVNNFPLAILCETGTAGLAAWGWAGWRLARRVKSAAAGAGAPRRQALALLVAANGAIWVQLLTFSQYNLPHIWVAAGLLVGAALPREDRR